MDKNKQRPCERSKGYALLSVLWIIAFIGTALTHGVFKQRALTTEVEGFIETTQQDFAIESAFLIASTFIKKATIPDPVFFVIDVNETRISLHIQPISGRYDLNRASQQQIADHLAKLGVGRFLAERISQEIGQQRNRNKRDLTAKFFDVRELKNLTSINDETYEKIWTEFNVDRPGVYVLNPPTSHQKSKIILPWLQNALDLNSAAVAGDIVDESVQARSRGNIFYSVKAYHEQLNKAVLREHRLVHLLKKDFFNYIAIF